MNRSFPLICFLTFFLAVGNANAQGIAEVPEPSGLLALMTGIGGLIGFIRLRRN